MLDPLYELLGSDPAQVLRVLLPCGQLGADHLGHVDAVVPRDGDILRDPKARLADGVDPADIGVIVGEEDAGGPLRQRQQPLCGLVAADRLMVHAFGDVSVRYREPQPFARTVETRQPVLRHRRLVPVDIGDAAVALSVHISDQGLHAAHIVGEHRRPVVEGVVQADDRKIGVGQLLDHGVEEVRTDDGDAVQAPGPHMLQVAGVRGAHVVADERDVVSAALRLHPKVVEHGGEILMGEPAVGQVREHDPDAVGPVGLQGAGGGVGRIAQLLRHVEDLLLGGLPHVPSPVEGLAHRAYRDAAVKRDIFNGNHGNTSLPREIVFVPP